MVEERKLAFVEHLEELRSRIIKSCIFLIAAVCLSYAFVDSLLPHLAKPVGRLIFIEPQEAFVTNIKVAFWMGLLLSAPFILFQVWRFISIGLLAHERKLIFIFGPISFVLFFTGACFGYFVIVPIGIKFLLSFETNFVIPMITVSRYVSFVGMLTLSFGIIFELPLAMLFLTKVGIISPQFLKNKRKHAIVLLFIAAAILTPPDVITQLLMALPLLILYEMGILCSQIAFKEKGTF